MSKPSSTALRTAAVLAAVMAAWLVSAWRVAADTAGGYALPVTSLATFGVAFPAIGLALTRTPRGAQVRGDAGAPGVSKRTAAAVLGYLVGFAVIVLGWGFSALHRALPAGRAHDVALFAVKLATMVAAPLALVAVLSPRGWTTLAAWFARPQLDRRLTVTTVVLAGLGVAVTAFALPTLPQLASLHASPLTFAWAAPVCLLALAVSVALPEEILYRVVVQTQCAALLRSAGATIGVSALVFALSHVPGLYLREDAAWLGVGHPTLGWAMAYAIAVLAPPGVFFGILWARTRSLVLVVVVHAAIDLLPNLADFVRTWG